MNSQPKTIVIVGAGFAGVYTARHLQRRLPRDWQVIVFSQENHLVFTPLLGDVVGSSINPLHIVWPIRQMVRHVTCRTAAVTGIDLSKQEVHYQTADGHPASQSYDHLVIACGSAVNLNIIPGMAAHGWPLKTVGDALVLRNHVIGLLEQAEVETDVTRKRRLLSVVVVGGGYSGVEVAGEISDLLRASSRFYQSVTPADVRVTLLEGRDRIVPELPASLSEFTLRKMRGQGIDIRLNAPAQAVTECGVRLGGGEEIDAGTVVCTIGTTLNPLVSTLALPLSNHRIRASTDLRVEGQHHIWTLGDCAAVPNGYDQKLSPPTAQFAVRQARHLAQNILHAIRDQPTRPFFYKPLGMFASIGNHKAVGLLLRLKVSGFFAWFLWRGIYLSKMPTLARKIQIAVDWAWQLVFSRDLVQLNLGQTERMSRAHFEAGQFVFHKGDPGDKFYIIERGRVGVYLDEAAAPVTVLNAGDHFGEGSLLREARRSASVRAEEPLDVLVIGRSSFSQLTCHLEVLRAALERSVQSVRSTEEFLRIARDHPKLSSGVVRDVMSRPVAVLPLDLRFAEAVRRSQEAGKGAYPIVDDQGRMVGICTRSDFYQAFQRLKPPQTPLVEILHRPVITVRETDSLTTALLTFLRQPIKRVVVVQDHDPSRPVGMLTPFDVLQVLADSMPGSPAEVPSGRFAPMPPGPVN